MGPLLVLANVSVQYEPSLTAALSDVALEVGFSEYVVVWGPRRSGRSSVLAVAAGLVPPTTGRVLFDGRPPRQALGREGGIGWAVDGPDAILGAGGATVLEQVVWPVSGMLSPQKARRLAESALSRCEIRDLAGESPWRLSQAERVKLLVARAFVRRPRLVLLDEPTVGVPAPEARELSEFLRSLISDGIAVLVTTDDSAPLAGSRSVTLQRGVLRGRNRAERGTVVPLGRRLGPAA
jgi:energy-coupling factor transporter ATP-binding protein EcfA2